VSRETKFSSSSNTSVNTRKEKGMKNPASRTAHRIMVFAAAALLAGAGQTQAQTPPATALPQLYLGLTITGAVGSNYLVQCVTDLARSNNWQTLTNFALPGSPYIWVDTRGAATNHLYYRVIAPGPYAAAVSLSGLAWTYDGAAKAASVTTVPTNLAVAVTYNGSATLPVNAGNYSVVARVTDSNYIGAATNTLTVNQAGLTATFSGYANGENESVISGVPSLSTTADTNSPAGTYSITVELGTLSASNYGFIFVAGTLTVTNATSPTNTPAGMVLIPAGSFTMGDCMGDGYTSELPLHSVYVSAFYMDKYPVTKSLWDEVYNWATSHGYTFDYPGSGKASLHPVQGIDVV
jgi:MBG domain/Sulfatase-modifying factor enzyme 1